MTVWIGANTMVLGLTGAEWAIVALATFIIFAIVGPKLARDVRGWMSGDTD